MFPVVFSLLYILLYLNVSYDFSIYFFLFFWSIPEEHLSHSTFSDKASSSVARAVSVLLESVWRPWTLSLSPANCLSLSFNCSNRFSICREEQKNVLHEYCYNKNVIS